MGVVSRQALIDGGWPFRSPGLPEFSGQIYKGLRTLNDPGFVYFISEGHSGAIKIGWAIDPAERLARLQVGNSKRLNVIGLIWCRPHVEGAWHGHWQDQRLIGEWYRRTPELTAAIREARTHKLLKHERDGRTTRAGRIVPIGERSPSIESEIERLGGGA